MKVTFNYFAQIRKQAGTESETIEVADGMTVVEALKTIKHGEAFSHLLFEDSGSLRAILLVVINDVPGTADQVLHDGDSVQVFSPVAGG